MLTTHRIEEFLADLHIPYRVMCHKHSASSLQTAEQAGVAASQVAKAVLLEGDGCVLAAVIPADQEVGLGRLRYELGEYLHLADEATVQTLFADCEPGAMPGLPIVWGIETVWDDDLLANPDIYLEAGDHVRLIHVVTQDLRRALADLSHAHFCRPRRPH